MLWRHMPQIVQNMFAQASSSSGAAYGHTTDPCDLARTRSHRSGRHQHKSSRRRMLVRSSNSHFGARSLSAPEGGRG
eukprot:1431774-Prymnesium_polylepis.1